MTCAMSLIEVKKGCGPQPYSLVCNHLDSVVMEISGRLEKETDAVDAVSAVFSVVPIKEHMTKIKYVQKYY